MTVQLRQCAAPCCNETRLSWGSSCSAWCRETTERDNQDVLVKMALMVTVDSPIAEAVWFELEKSYGRWRDYMDIYFTTPVYQARVYMEDE